MHVDVDQARADHLAGEVEDLERFARPRAGCRFGPGPQTPRGADSGHDPVGEQEVEGAIDTLRGIDQPPAGEQDRLHVADLRAPASR